MRVQIFNVTLLFCFCFSLPHSKHEDQQSMGMTRAQVRLAYRCDRCQGMSLILHPICGCSYYECHIYLFFDYNTQYLMISLKTNPPIHIINVN